ncbi:LTA synthase family protein [Flavobacterium dankookense]|uniref:Phosphoglycerol transferase MdoB-like AlkP superfamily enzyme n=1 Tax=Flavobacterium dankookense TaxID=706186 RepID=A0A4R6Q7H3_9FLAO|nr:alkaline phosphatase family protein [Flavobacterium dankookense]TDP58030.1 phosphoglycerol transferase MdoB-like AlkP superfamily enzyme [Flavobacterium dankookense]
MLKKQKYALFINLLVVYLSLNFLLRFVFILHPITQSDFTFLEIVKIFGLGFLSDILLFIVGSSLFWIYILFLSNSKYKKPLGYFIFVVLCLLLLYVSFFNTILNEYGGSLPEIGISFIAIKTVLFGLLLFFPQYRNKIRLVLFSIAVFLFVLIMVQNSVSEFFFWNEFGVRYNFIAVDYLVYTNAVIGNIMESYPVIPLFTGIGIITILITYWIVKNSKSLLDNLPTFNQKKKNILLYSILFSISLFLIPTLAKKESSNNVFVNEIQANGIYKFYTAFNNSELDYNSYYKTMAINDAFGILQNQLKGIKNKNTIREINYDSTELKKNVVLITVESLSEEFMTSFGNEKHITPFLDSLAKKSLHFTNMYATGNRTVRGLEAVTLCLPPSAAESIVKRKDNKNKFSTASIFKDKGYQVKYMYGGDAYFDNMDDFFGGNGYDVIDKKTFLPNEITFDNIWGVCDEDMYRKAIKEMNKEDSQNKPFFNHIMTVSNHRPFTYPDGKIDIPSDAKSRNGGVKYTDYAMKQFFLMAEKQTWFKNTIFVIVADHCASSSGKTELPLEKYRIPAFIYAPGFVEAKHIPTLMSQIDLMPTLFGLLHFDYSSKFYGQDVFNEDYNPRAFVATYQDLGLIKDNVITILSPVKQVKQYSLEQKHNDKIKPEYEIHYIEKPLRELRQDLIDETVAFYQTTAYLLQNKKLNK